MTQLLTIILAMILGYSCKWLPFSTIRLNQLLSWMIIAILFLMGYVSGSYIINIVAELYNIGKIVITFVGLLFLCNCLAIGIYSLFSSIHQQHKNAQASLGWRYYLRYLFDGVKYLITVLIGIAIGYGVQMHIAHVELLISALLLIILFIIGFQLRQQNISLKTVLLNKVGLMITLLVVISSLAAGIIAAKMLALPIRTGLILTSGFGWYTLSGILTGQVVSQQFGTIAFFIDFIRELIAIVMIPLVGRLNVLIPIGYSGATAMDFTLPIIKINLGERVVPIAMTSGLLLTILVPIMIPLLGKLG